MSTRSVGSRYRRKAGKWWEERGYIVATVERFGRWGNTDLWGADLLVKNGRSIAFVQVKLMPKNKDGTAQACIDPVVKVFAKFAPWPPCISLYSMTYARYVREPRVIEVTDRVHKLKG